MAESVLDVIIDPTKAQAGARKVNEALQSMATKATQVTTHLGQKFEGVKNAVFSLQGALAALGVGVLSRSLIETAINLDKMERSMRTVTTSSAQAAIQLDRVRAIQSEFQSGDLPTANAFRLLVSHDIPNAEAALRTFANVALNLDQNIETVVRSVLAGNERSLRELGARIVDLGQGEVELDFNGMRIRAEKTDQAIRQGLLQLFAKGLPDATKNTGNSVDFQLKRIKDAWSDLQVTIMRGGLSDFLAATFKTIADGMGRLNTADRGEAIARGIEGTLKTLALDAAVVIDTLRPLSKITLGILKDALAAFNQLPPEAQTLGLMGYFYFGKAGKAALIAGLALAQRLNITMDDIAKGADAIEKGFEGLAKSSPLGMLLEKGIGALGNDQKKAIKDAVDAVKKDGGGLLGLDEAFKKDGDSAVDTLLKLFARIDAETKKNRAKRKADEARALNERKAGTGGIIAGGGDDQAAQLAAQLAKLRGDTDQFIRQERAKQSLGFDPEKADALNRALQFTSMLHDKNYISLAKQDKVTKELLDLWIDGKVPTEDLTKQLTGMFAETAKVTKETRQFNAELQISQGLMEDAARLADESRDLATGTRGRLPGAFPGAFGTEQPSVDTIVNGIRRQMAVQKLQFDEQKARAEATALVEARNANAIARTTFEMQQQKLSQDILNVGVGQHVDVRERQIRVLQRLQELQAKGVVITDELTESIEKESAAIQDSIRRTRNVDAINAFVDHFRVGFDTIAQSGLAAYGQLEDALVQMIDKGKFDFKSFTDFVRQEFIRLSIRNVLGTALNGGSGGGGGILGLLGGLGGGGGAAGGAGQLGWLAKIFGSFGGSGFGAASSLGAGSGNLIPVATALAQRGGMFSAHGRIRGYQWGGIPGYEGGGISHNERLIRISEGHTPEAIVPLRGGKIPVEMRGGGARIHAPITIITPDAAGVRRSDTQIQAQMSTALLRAARRIN